MTPAIRDALAADRPALIDLWVVAWQAAMPRIDFDGRRDWIAHHLDHLCAGGAALLVAVVGGALAGFVTVDEQGVVDQLVVAVAHQGQGVAQALIAAARRRGPGRLSLTVNVDNGRAIRFYERQGFRPVAHGTNQLSGLPVLHMEG